MLWNPSVQVSSFGAQCVQYIVATVASIFVYVYPGSGRRQIYSVYSCTADSSWLFGNCFI